MRGFWGLMRAYWFSDRWMEAWALTAVIALFTAAASKTSVWMAEASGELVNSIAFFHDPEQHWRRCRTLLNSAGLLVLLVFLKDAGIIGIRHLVSTTLHRKWRGWLNGRFNDALLDGNHTHFHLQHGGRDANGGAVAPPDNVDQRVQESIKGMTGGAIGLAMGIMGVVHLALLRRPEADRDSRRWSTDWNSSAPTAAPSWPLRRSRSMCRSTPISR